MPTEYEKHEKGDLELIMLKNVFVSPGDDEYKCSLNLCPLLLSLGRHCFGNYSHNSQGFPDPLQIMHCTPFSYHPVHTGLQLP